MTKKSSELHDEGWGGQQVLRVPRNICKAFVMEVGLGFEEARGDWGVGPFKFGKAVACDVCK